MEKQQSCRIGLVGLGVMGQNLVLNMADKGHSVAVYNRTGEKTREFIRQKAGDREILPAYDIQEFVSLLRRPRAIMIMVPAGKPVDGVIEKLSPFLQDGDMIVDCGNSHFFDTDRRGKFLADKGILYLGMGVSGGEFGARHGPSMMPGGPREGYDRINSILEAAAAKVNGEPCVAYLGNGAAGHYVKMVHNGIEYGMEQLLAESYDVMKSGLHLENDALHRIYSRWNREELDSFLVGITADIFAREDDISGGRIIDVVLDVAKQKGTGIWTAREAKELRVPAPTIDIAVAMRCMSEFKEERERAGESLTGPGHQFEGDLDVFVERIKNALYAAVIVTYAQGLALLRRASEVYGYDLDLEAVTRIWRGGCIIRAALLERIRAAYKEDPKLPNLLLHPQLAREVVDRQQDWRTIVQAASKLGIPAAGFMVSLAYFDSYRSARLPANLIQAQRDYFGAHTYERIDLPGSFHTQWLNE